MHKNLQPFSNIFFLLYGNKKIGLEGFSEKPSTPIFFICSYFLGVGEDENLKIYLAWPELFKW